MFNTINKISDNPYNISQNQCFGELFMKEKKNRKFGILHAQELEAYRDKYTSLADGFWVYVQPITKFPWSSSSNKVEVSIIDIPYKSVKTKNPFKKIASVVKCSINSLRFIRYRGDEVSVNSDNNLGALVHDSLVRIKESLLKEDKMIDKLFGFKKK